MSRLTSAATRPRFDVLDHATSEIASGSKLGIDATKKLPGEGLKRPWPPPIKMDAAVKAKVGKLFEKLGKWKCPVTLPNSPVLS
jgi:3-polyprenyl-4-hydroxybenzoate decarboxylase